MLRRRADTRIIALTWVLALFTGSVAKASVIPLDQPVAQILPYDRFVHIWRDLAGKCPRTKIDAETPVSTVLTDEFWTSCLRGSAAPEPARDFSPLFRAPSRATETYLRAALAPHWLTLGMTKEEIAHYRAGQVTPDLKPLNEFTFTGPSGRPTRPGNLPKRGLFVVRDFTRAWAAELELPEDARFLDGYKRKADAAMRMKAQIAEHLARTCTGALIER